MSHDVVSTNFTCRGLISPPEEPLLSNPLHKWLDHGSPPKLSSMLDLNRFSKCIVSRWSIETSISKIMSPIINMWSMALPWKFGLSGLFLPFCRWVSASDDSDFQLLCHKPIWRPPKYYCYDNRTYCFWIYLLWSGIPVKKNMILFNFDIRRRIYLYEWMCRSKLSGPQSLPLKNKSSWYQ